MSIKSVEIYKGEDVVKWQKTYKRPAPTTKPPTRRTNSTATPAEDEPSHGELDGYVSPDCKCKYCEFGRNQIALRKIDEYCQGEGSDWYITSTKTWIKGLRHWLQEDK